MLTLKRKNALSFYLSCRLTNKQRLMIGLSLGTRWYILLTSFHYRVLLFPAKRKVRFFDQSDIWFSPPVAKSVLLIYFCCLGYYTMGDRLSINE